MSEPLWRGLTHQQVYELVHSGPGPYVSDAAITAWSDAETALRSIDADLAAAMTKAGDWEGAAADATRSGLTPLGSWAVGAAHAAERAAITVQQHQEQVATVRAALPEPGPDPNGLSPFSFKGPGTAPREVQTVANAELATQAFHVMDSYATNTGLIQHWAPPWSAPPTVTVAVADPATPHTAVPAGGPSRTGRHVSGVGVAAATSAAGIAAGAGGLVPGASGMARARVGVSGTGADVGGSGAEVGAGRTGDGTDVSAEPTADRGGAGASGVVGAGAGVDGSGIGVGGSSVPGIGTAGAQGGVSASRLGQQDGGGLGGPGGGAAGGGVVGLPAVVSSTNSEGPATVEPPGRPMRTWRDLPDLARPADDPGYAGSGRPTSDGGVGRVSRIGGAPGLRSGSGSLFGEPESGNGLPNGSRGAEGSATRSGAGPPDAHGGGVAGDPVSGRGARLSGDPLSGIAGAGAENPAARAGSGSGYMPMSGGGSGGEGHTHRRPAFLLDDSGAFADNRWFTEAVITPDDPLPTA